VKWLGVRVHPGWEGEAERADDDEILLTHDYCNGGTCWRGLFPGLILFRLVVPPLQIGVVKPYLIQGI
jgi:hypothetical protein